MNARGSREEVWAGTARATSGGLTKSDLVKNARGTKIVSIKQSNAARARYPALKARLCAAAPACACKGLPCVCTPSQAAPVAATAPVESAADRAARILAEAEAERVHAVAVANAARVYLATQLAAAINEVTRGIAKVPKTVRTKIDRVAGLLGELAAPDSDELAIAGQLVEALGKLPTPLRALYLEVLAPFLETVLHQTPQFAPAAPRRQPAAPFDPSKELPVEFGNKAIRQRNKELRKGEEPLSRSEMINYGRRERYLEAHTQAAQLAVQTSFVADYAALLTDPVIDVAQKAAAATRGLTAADRQTIDKVVADLEALKSGHQETERPSENLSRFQKAFPAVVNRLEAVKSKPYWSQYKAIEADLYPIDPNPRAPRDPLVQLRQLNKYRHVGLGRPPASPAATPK